MAAWPWMFHSPAPVECRRPRLTSLWRKRHLAGWLEVGSGMMRYCNWTLSTPLLDVKRRQFLQWVTYVFLDKAQWDELSRHIAPLTCPRSDLGTIITWPYHHTQRLDISITKRKGRILRNAPSVWHSSTYTHPKHMVLIPRKRHGELVWCA